MLLGLCRMVFFFLYVFLRFGSIEVCCGSHSVGFRLDRIGQENTFLYRYVEHRRGNLGPM